MHDRHQLTLRVTVGYAAAEAGVNTVETILRLYLLFYYTNVVGLSAHLAGLATGLAVAWDAAIDPVMGLISDRTRHRFGGRRGYLLPGAVLVVIGTVWVFRAPPFDSQLAMFGWLLTSYCFLNTGMTVLTVPYWAMAGELTNDPHERTKLFGARFAFANFGAFAAAGLPLLFLGASGGDNADTMPSVSFVAAALVLGTACVSWVATARMRFQFTPLHPGSVLRAFVEPFGNPTFVPLIAAYVIAYIGIGVNAAAFLYYYEYVLELAVGQRQGVLAAFLATFTVSIVAWVWLARRFGKLRPLVFGAFVVGVANTALYTLVPPKAFGWVLGFGAFGLGSFVGAIVLLDTLLTDVLDHDRLVTRQLRAGLFFGVWRFASKVARAITLTGVGEVLGAAGYKEKSALQPPDVHTVLVVMFGPGVGAFFLIACLILWRYRFTDEKQAQVRRLLARRDARVSSGER